MSVLILFLSCSNKPVDQPPAPVETKDVPLRLCYVMTGDEPEPPMVMVNASDVEQVPLIASDCDARAFCGGFIVPVPKQPDSYELWFEADDAAQALTHQLSVSTIPDTDDDGHTIARRYDNTSREYIILNYDIDDASGLYTPRVWRPGPPFGVIE